MFHKLTDTQGRSASIIAYDLQIIGFKAAQGFMEVLEE